MHCVFDGLAKQCSSLLQVFQWQICSDPQLDSHRFSDCIQQSLGNGDIKRYLQLHAQCCCTAKSICSLQTQHLDFVANACVLLVTSMNNCSQAAHWKLSQYASLNLGPAYNQHIRQAIRLLVNTFLLSGFMAYIIVGVYSISPSGL